MGVEALEAKQGSLFLGSSFRSAQGTLLEYLVHGRQLRSGLGSDCPLGMWGQAGTRGCEGHQVGPESVHPQGQMSPNQQSQFS